MIFSIKQMLKELLKKKSHYSFSRPFGVPVRYHDFLDIKKDINIDFVEFHLSYQDMNLNINEYLNETYDIDFCVHSPELFADDHILDLCSNDDEYLEKSKNLLQKVVNVTEELNKYLMQDSKTNNSCKCRRME